MNGVIAVLTLDQWGPATSAFPIYIAVIGLGLASLVRVRTQQPERSATAPPVVAPR